jgi:hypothetical protein
MDLYPSILRLTDGWYNPTCSQRALPISCFGAYICSSMDYVMGPDMGFPEKVEKYIFIYI